MAMTPAEYVEQIDKAFNTYKGRISRYDKLWSTFSYPMNAEIRSRIADKDNSELLKIELRNVLNYWIIISELIETYYIGGLANMVHRMNLWIEAKQLKKIILT